MKMFEASPRNKALDEVLIDIRMLLPNLFELKHDSYVMDERVLQIIRVLLDIRKRLKQE